MIKKTQDMHDQFAAIYQEICAHPMNSEMSAKGYKPLYTASAKAKIVIVGQAPGRKAQETMKPWNDASGDTLRKWLDVDKEQFYDPDIISLLPMDFYYPGKGSHGDLPPRKDFAPMRHPRILALMESAELFILVGAYAQSYYLTTQRKKNLTETVKAYAEYLPRYFPLVHPSPLNFRRQTNNPWFTKEVIPALQKHVKTLLYGVS